MKKRGLKRLMAILTATIVGTTLMVGCGSSDKKELNVFNWTEYIPQSVLDGFEKEYGIKVNYSTYSSNEELLSKVKSSAKGTYDIVVPSDFMVTIMQKSDMLQPLDLTKIKNFKNIDPAVLDKDFDKGNKYSIPYLAGGAPIAVNKSKVKEEIKSYNDLLNPKYKNNIIVLDEQRQLIGSALRATGHSMNDTDSQSLADAKKFLEKLKPNIKAFDSDSPKTALITGEVAIGLVWNAEIALAMRENKDIEVVYPEEGIYCYIDNFTIPKGAKHLDSAYLFMDYILRPEVSKLITEEFPYKNVNKAAESSLPDSYINNKASNIPSEEISKGEVIQDVGDSTTKFDKIWSEFKGN